MATRRNEDVADVGGQEGRVAEGGQWCLRLQAIKCFGYQVVGFSAVSSTSGRFLAFLRQLSGRKVCDRLSFMHIHPCFAQTHMAAGEEWKEACASGDWARVREVAMAADVALLSEMLVVACGHGHLDVAKWLVGLGGVDIHAVGECAFRWACNNDYLECARVLVGLDPEYAWPRVEMEMLQSWGDSRDAWLKAVLGVSAHKQSRVLGAK